jgi:predicted membrane channel-forming protein YqfA (hemolysin III family)
MTEITIFTVSAIAAILINLIYDIFKNKKQNGKQK